MGPEKTDIVGFVGLGKMGLPMATQLVRAGYEVMGFDPLARARECAGCAGISICESVEHVMRAATKVVLMLPSSEVVESVVLSGAFLNAVRPDTVIIDMSSSNPVSTRALAARLAEKEIRVVDAPVSGGVSGAMAGTLTVMVGGLDRNRETLSSLLSVFGQVIDAGPVGAGHAAKALNNLLSATHLWSAAEAITVGERFGLDPDVMLSIFNSSSGRSGSTEVKFPRFIRPGSYDSGFRLSLMLKDIGIAMELARDMHASSPLSATVERLWGSAAQDLDESADHTEVARWISSHASNM